MSIEAEKQAYEVPLVEQLESVPTDARLVIDDADGMGTHYIPVGRMCHDAAKALRTAIGQAGKPSTRPATREEKIVNPGVYEVPVQEPVAELMHEPDVDVLRQKMKGRAQFLRNRGEIKTPQLLEIAYEFVTPPAAQRQ